MKKMCYYWMLAAFVLLFGCSGSRTLKLHDWQELPKEQYTIPPYAKNLSGYKIALDPGHGGLAHLPGYKRGPTGKREPVMNLNVAQFLKEFLEKAGAHVVLTRTSDYFVSLQDRVDIAAEQECDFLVSLHHNADSKPETNYVSVYYHLHPDYSPLSMDLARNVYFELLSALRLPQVAEDGLLTDRMIYPAGFGLLRRATMPAILLETSFFSNPREEKRLMDWRYNRREAYAIFLGLAKWAAGGIPETELLAPTGIARDKQPEVVYGLRDGIVERGGRSDGRLLAYSESVSLKLDGKIVPASVDLRRKLLRFQPDSALTNGPHTVQVDLQNLFKNHNFPRIDTLIIASPVDSASFEVPTRILPADDAALLPVVFTLFDADSQPVWDGTEALLSASTGTISPEKLTLSNSRGRAYFRAASDTGETKIYLQADAHRDTLALRLIAPGTTWLLSGMVIDDSSDAGIADVQIKLDDSISTFTDHNGGFYLLDPPVGAHSLSFQCDGYTSEIRSVSIDSGKSEIVLSRLRANLGGLLHGESIVIDAALGGTEHGDPFEGISAAQANLQLAQALADTLRWAGVAPELVRQNDTTYTVDDRITAVNAVPSGWYLKLLYKKSTDDSVRVRITGYPGNLAGEAIAEAMKQTFQRYGKTRVTIELNTNVPEVLRTNKTALEVLIHCRQPDIFQRDLPALFDGIVRQKIAEKSGAVREKVGEN